MPRPVRLRRPGPPPSELPPPRRPARPLLLAADTALLDDALRLAATAGVELEVAAECGAARTSWAAAPLVLVADALAGEAARTLPRRTGVLVLASDLDDAAVWRRAVDLGAERVLVLPGDDVRLVDALAAAARRGPRGVALAVVGGCGGAGASVLATALAVTAAKDRSEALLVDVDPLGGGLDLLIGRERGEGLRWPEAVARRLFDDAGPGSRRPGGDDVPAGDRLLSRAGVSVLAWSRVEDAPPPTPDAVAAVVSGAAAGGQVVVVDLPRALDERARAALSVCDGVLLVVPAEVRATAAAAAVLPGVEAECPDVRLVVRTVPGSSLHGSAVAEALRLPVAGHLAHESDLAATLERGDLPAGSGRGPLAALCRDVLADVAPTTAAA